MGNSKIIRLGLTDISISKPPIAEFHNGTWRIWTAYNPTLTKGTFVSLEADGKMSQCTINPDDSISQAPIS